MGLNKINVGIIGFGTMGQSLASYLCLFPEIDQIFIKTGKKNIFLKYEFEKKIKLVSKFLKKDFDSRFINKIIINQDYHEFKLCNIVIEAVNEDLEIKIDILKNLSKNIPKSILITSNTSSFKNSDLLSFINYPERFCCTHFFNPIWSTEYVEIINHENFDNDLKFFLNSFLNIINKKTINLNSDLTGFAVNRILIPMINEAIKLIEENAITKEELDMIFEKNLGMPMGPIKLSDFIGNDIVLSILHNLHKDNSYNPKKISNILDSNVKNKFLGKKNKRGFYNY